jgi:hypothetical protein
MTALSRISEICAVIEGGNDLGAAPLPSCIRREIASLTFIHSFIDRAYRNQEARSPPSPEVRQPFIMTE